MSQERWTIDELCALTGLTRRTIRFYVEKGLIEAPEGRGRGGYYGPEQLRRLRLLQAGRAEGLSLQAIESRFGPSASPAAAAVTRVTRWQLAPGLWLEADETAAVRYSHEVAELLASARRFLGGNHEN